jgi:hypothetical protein
VAWKGFEVMTDHEKTLGPDGSLVWAEGESVHAYEYSAMGIGRVDVLLRMGDAVRVHVIRKDGTGVSASFFQGSFTEDEKAALTVRLESGPEISEEAA